MTFWERLITTIGERRIIAGLGIIFIIAAVVRGYVRINAGTPVESALFVSVFISIPGFFLIYGGYRLPDEDVHPDFRVTVAQWTLGGFTSMILFLFAYNIVVEGGISNPDRAFTILSSFSSLAGFWLGKREAQTKTTRRELDRTVERLRASNERLEQFAYGASHDLQEPLRMVSSYLQLIESRSGTELSEENHEFLQFAVDGAERMRAMIEGLLAYSRIDTESDSVTTVDLEEVIEDVIEDMRVAIDESGAEITVGEVPLVEGNETQLGELFQNVLKNAIEYNSAELPEVHVSSTKNDGGWTISVRDNGIGIDPADHDRIFGIFDRLHTREEYPGTGIGLALCERIVECHSGELWVESESGEGSTFSFTLPGANTTGRESRNR